MSKSTAIVWFRNDLRLADNLALAEAAKEFDKVLPLFIWWPKAQVHIGSASKVWLHHSLLSLDASLQNAGSRLFVRTGNPVKVLKEISKETGASAVFWNRSYEPAELQLEDEIKASLNSSRVLAGHFAGNLLLEPWEARKKNNTPYLVFTPFAKSSFEKLGQVHIVSKPGNLPTAPRGVRTGTIGSLELLPTVRWDNGITDAWQIGEDAAERSLRRFIKNGLRNYDETRNLPALDDGVSRLSPHLHFGEISPRQIWAAVTREREKLSGKEAASATVFLKELLWREFSHHLLYHFPTMPELELREEFDYYPWDSANEYLRAWQKGLTGFPIVDAGMRQLWQTGWMHNRVRMIVGSFLIKDLGIDWRTGEEWFWDTLVDADLAQNSMNWQWVAGCGADASPFFRIFNPTSQGKKFDPEGNYIRKYVPELAKLPAKWIHAPQDAPAEVLQKAGVAPGDTYPLPIVDHATARAESLRNYKRLR